jgi:hypothetical protein
MRHLKKFRWLAAALLFPSVLYAGQINGSVTSAGKGVARAAIEINCSGAITKGATAPDGSYRIAVSQQGQCTFTLPDYAGRPSAVIFSNPDTSSYNFELVSKPDGSFELRRK